MDNSKGLSLAPLLGHGIVTLHTGTGPNKQKSTIHKELLGRKSPPLKAAFDGGFKEGLTNEMDLSEDDPQAVGLFVTWLYTDSIPIQQAGSEGTPNDAAILYFHTMVFAEKYMMPDLEENCYKAIISILGTRTLPRRTFLEELFDLELALPRLKFYLANIFAYVLVQKKASNKAFEDLLKSNSGFAAYLCRVIAWRARLGAQFGRLLEYHPAGLSLFCDYFATGIEGDEFDVAESLLKSDDGVFDMQKTTKKVKLSHG